MSLANINTLVYEYVEKGYIDTALDLLIERIDELMSAGEWEEIDYILCSADLAQLNTDLIIGYLAFTYTGKEHLPGRKRFVLDVEDFLCGQESPERVERLLEGLR